MTGYNILIQGVLHNMLLTLAVVKYAAVLSDATRCPMPSYLRTIDHRAESTTTAQCSIVPGETVVVLWMQHTYVHCPMAPW